MKQILIFGSCLLASAAILCAAPATIIPIPPATEILTRLNPGHPRLLASPDDFARLQKDTQKIPILKKWYKTVQTQAEDLLNKPPSKYEIPDGLRLLATSRQVLSRVYTLAMVYKMSGDRRFADRAWVELEAAANFKDWNPRHFLDTAEMTHAFWHWLRLALFLLDARSANSSAQRHSGERPQTGA